MGASGDQVIRPGEPEVPLDAQPGPTPESGPAEALAALNDRLEQLQTAAADGFDPVRFQYLLALVRRASDKREPVQQILASKAAAALASYEADFASAGAAGADTLTVIERDFASANSQARQLFDRCQYPALQRLAERLQRQTRQPGHCSLAAITGELASEAPAADPASVGLLLDEYLQQQETRILQSLATDSNAAAAPGPAPQRQAQPPELKASRKLRQQRQKQGANKLVDQAIQDIDHGPASPGPLNPQMLATRALTLMRDLSPHYLNRFLSHMDTLLWLEQADVKKTAATASKSKGKEQGAVKEKGAAKNKRGGKAGRKKAGSE
ncbi:DUF2894 domain-containing protein [Pseudomaricurvus alcaniphilus]|uniref:DUF2894 domain-containing protein n=1 Tax=Pseudomaricurvus alcaniphilus TaxID=1166482 RepID=UPI0014072FAB|nr:DUF2894 domain-containing protein [Pseudomaricurvus alcaniphilus]NHN39825.1 DUF2894 domain-containing protein [Pseudomaricurvus alcaniphilus]